MVSGAEWSGGQRQQGDEVNEASGHEQGLHPTILSHNGDAWEPCRTGESS